MEHSVRRPRAIILANGARLAWKTIELNNNNHYQADSFRIKAPIRKGQQPGIDAAWWRAQGKIQIDIYIGFPPDENYGIKELTHMFSGITDFLSHDMVTDTIELVGRDFTAYMIDTKTTEKWTNQLASDIAIKFAIKYGLIPKVVPTERKAGTLYDNNHTKLTDQSSEWNLLVWLAQQEGYEVYVNLSELHFEPKAEPMYYDLYWKYDHDKDLKWFSGPRLTFERDLSLAKDIKVRVESYNYKKNVKITAEVESTRTKDKTVRRHTIPVGGVQTYVKYVPNKSKEQCLQLAQRWLRQITSHQVRMQIGRYPGDVILNPRHIVRMHGSEVYDDNYYTESITRHLSMEEGFTMDIMAKNHDTNSQGIL